MSGNLREIHGARDFRPKRCSPNFPVLLSAPACFHNVCRNKLHPEMISLVVIHCDNRRSARLERRPCYGVEFAVRKLCVADVCLRATRARFLRAGLFRPLFPDRARPLVGFIPLTIKQVVFPVSSRSRPRSLDYFLSRLLSAHDFSHVVILPLSLSRPFFSRLDAARPYAPARVYSQLHVYTLRQCPLFINFCPHPA